MNQITDNTPISPAQQPLPQMPPEPRRPQGNRDAKMWARFTIVAIIVVGAFIYAKYQNRSATPSEKPASQKTSDVSLNQEAPASQTQIRVTGNPAGESQNAKTDAVRVEGDKIVVSARKGNGRTHIARAALAEYLRIGGSQGLKPEHKIFIEDYLQKRLGDKNGVKAGEEFAFSQNQIQDAIDQSLKLSAGQIQNLRKYVQLVPSLR